MIKIVFKFKSKVWIWPGLATWYMVTLPIEQSRKIKQLFGNLHRGWRSLPAVVSIGPTSPRLRRASKTKWKTSVFFDSKQKAYILPLKALVRKQENIKAGDVLSFSIEITP
jgi:hypothetical protein